jgi:hypothetical protein
MEPIVVEVMRPDLRSATLCAGIYARSWPTTASCCHDQSSINERLQSRTLSYWQDYLNRSTVRLHGSNSQGSGFLLVTPTSLGLELSYIFTEPETFGTGLAGGLYDITLNQIETKMYAWVLECNERSQKFLVRRGWRITSTEAQPEWANDKKFVLMRQ